jgi:tRNA-2-methylthio-N6-dimethylallyladenosine synthase
VPDVSITTDIITGFSGETPEDHARTLAALDECAFDAAFTFKYSVREGSIASGKLEDDVPEAEKQRRLEDVIAGIRVHQVANNLAYVGRTETLLVSGPSRRNAELAGRTSSFKQVVFPDPTGAVRRGDLVRVRITGTTSATLRGELVPHAGS